MEQRFVAAVSGALGAHAALIVLAAFSSARGGQPSAAVSMPRSPDVEVSLLAEEQGELPASSSAAAGELVRSERLARVGHSRSGTRQGAGQDETGDHAGATDEPLAEAQAAPSVELRPKIELGLDGTVFRSALLEGSRRAQEPRRRVVHDDWSALAVRLASEQAAPREGSALLTIEWDSEGRLRAIATSAHSSESGHWSRFAEALRPVLSRRPRRPPEGRGLRLVYLVKSELVAPLNQRSVLPRADYGSLETVTDRVLPPAVTLNLGVKADTSVPAERVVSVTLADSQVL